MTNIIIDTNICLNFYRLNGGQSLEMLKNLNKLIKDKKFKLVLPKQIEDEFIRQKNSKTAIYGDHILNFQKGLEVQFTVPALIKSNQKINQIKKIIKKLKSLKKEAVEDYKNRVFNPDSKINRELNKLFSSAHHPLENEQILQKAWFRTLRGNPPRKDNSSFGDSIIWETILDQLVDDDLILISGDGDFESEIKDGELNELLEKEWAQRSRKKITLYTKLGTFINYQSKRKIKPIKEETIREEDRLNSLFSAPVLSYKQGLYEGLIIGNPAATDDLLLSNMYSAAGIKNRCICCGAEINELNNYSVFRSSYCENCQNQFSPGQTCSKCGKHFHRDMFNIKYSASTVLFDNSKCDDCQNK